MKPKREPENESAAMVTDPQSRGAPSSKGQTGKPITVSVVEDDAWIRDNLAALLDATPGFSCLSRFDCAESALAALPREQPDVVLMDIGLPRMNGIDCVKRLKALAPSIQVIMLTVYGDSERVFAALRAGGSGYLLKRTEPEDLFAAIRQVHRGESPMDGQIARKIVQYFNRASDPASGMEQLSPREREVLDRLAKGEAYKQIADHLGMSIETLRGHIKSVYQKLHVHSRGEAVAKYMLP